MGILVVLKWYNNFIFIRTFYDMEDELNQLMWHTEPNLRQGDEGFEFVNPANIIVAASFIMVCRDDITTVNSET
jgi:hypothetical protein